MSSSESPTTSQIPRRFVFGAGGAALAVGVTQALASPAEAAAASTPWKVGGTDAITTDGSNFLGPLNVAPLIFKTKPNATDPIKERMRIAPNGRVGVGTTVPACLFEAKTSGTPALQGNTTSASSASVGVSGLSTNGYGVQGQGAVIGVYGTGAYGTYGTGSSYGSYGYSDTGYGSYNASGSNFGSYHYSGSSTACYASGSTYGVQGFGTTGVYGSGGTGVRGNGGTGVYGTGGSSTGNSGVNGSSGYVGLWGTGGTWGVYAITGSGSGGYGVYGATDNAGGYGVFSDGDCHVNGTLSKTAGSFKIDHPLDPERKWLSHSFVESPDMMNIYNGNATTDADGVATVTMPSYFHALNQDFRYQLTTIGQPAQAWVKAKLSKGRFVLATDKPHVEVSWQVTGIRHDAYAKEHPIQVETAKSASEKGTRSFVPAGSSARRMELGPRPLASAKEPVGRQVVTPHRLPLGVPD